MKNDRRITNLHGSQQHRDHAPRNWWTITAGRQFTAGMFAQRKQSIKNRARVRRYCRRQRTIHRGSLLADSGLRHKLRTCLRTTNHMYLAAGARRLGETYVASLVHQRRSVPIHCMDFKIQNQRNRTNRTNQCGLRLMIHMCVMSRQSGKVEISTTHKVTVFFSKMP